MEEEEPGAVQDATLDNYYIFKDRGRAEKNRKKRDYFFKKKKWNCEK